MPLDKHTNGATPKPFTPALGSNFRSTKSPLTPRLAGSAPTSPAIAQRKDFPGRNGALTRDETSASPLNSNITPRSSARRSKTGNESPAVSIGKFQSGSPAITNESGLAIASPKISALSPSPAVTVQRRLSGAKSMVNIAQQITPQFFRADEARSTVSLPPSTESNLELNSPNLTDEKFFHVNDIRPSRPPLRLNQRPISSGQISSISRGAPSSRLLESTPKSPTKELPSIIQQTSPQRLTPLTTRTSPPSVRRQSVGEKSISSQSLSHRKSASVSSISILPIRRSSRADDIPFSEPKSFVCQTSNSIIPQTFFVSTPQQISPRSSSNASGNIPNPADYFQSMESLPPPLASPQLDNAASARRERKVLDLEISNSSLLAINKTLERELRKQSLELRRFRRLSQSGRLSIASADRNISGKSNFSLETLSEQTNEEQESNQDESEDGLEDYDDSILSEASSLQNSDIQTRQRARDEKRLMLDLSKHQQLLIDSQKLNQSIRKCLTCTEELIRDGNKALAYRVGIGDLKLGGRVLTHDEELDHTEFRPQAWTDEAATAALKQ